MVKRYRLGLRYAEWNSYNLLKNIPFEFVIVSLQKISKIYDTMK